MEWPRFGYRRLHVMLKRKGWSVTRKLVLRRACENDWLVRAPRRDARQGEPRERVEKTARADETADKRAQAACAEAVR